MTNYAYFSGANVTIEINNEKAIECAGISYVVQTSDQPIYGYASTQFDLVLNGREIVQGNFLLNLKQKSQLESNFGLSDTDNIDNVFGNYFDIDINFGKNARMETLNNCRLLSRGTTIQISEQVILEEYSFVAQFISYDSK